MNRRTLEALNRINLEFYDEHGEEFSSTRSRPWPGWARIVAHLEQRLRQGGRQSASILDLGCGNGRFSRLLAQRLGPAIAYWGVDVSPSLLAAARTRQPLRRGWSGKFVCADLVRQGLSFLGPDALFDLVAAFGILHHVPSFERRGELLRRSAELLAPGGLLAVTFWQFGESPRFLQRVVDWSDHNQESAEPIEVAELEPGDLLLAWGEIGSERQTTRRRYCHYADPPEAERLVDSLGLAKRETFTSDGEGGALNLYYLLEVPS